MLICNNEEMDGNYHDKRVVCITLRKQWRN